MMKKLTSPPLKKKKAHKRRTKKKLVFSAGDEQTSIQQVPNESNPRDGDGDGDGDGDTSAASQGGGGGGGPEANNTQREGEPSLKDGDVSSAASQGGGGPETNNTQGEGEPNLKDGDGDASSAASQGSQGGGGQMNNTQGEGDPKLKDGDEDGYAASSTEADSNPAKDVEQDAEAQDQSPKNKVIDGSDKIPDGDQLCASYEVVEPTEMEDVNGSASEGQESEQEEQKQEKEQEEEEEQEDGSLENKVMGGQCNEAIVKKSSSSFTQIFTHEDVIQILKGYIDFKYESSEKTLTHFHESMKGKLHMEFTKLQVTEKLRRLKENYSRNVNKANQQGGLSTDDSTVFELSEKIWGENGFDSRQVVKRERVESETGKRGKKRQRKIVDVDMEQFYPLVHQSFNMNLGGVVALDMLKKYWTLIGSDEAEHFEAEWQKLARKEMELYLKKMALFQDQAKIIVEHLKKTPNR